MTCCNHDCRQGRDCEGSRTATRLALGLPFLTSCDGGTKVSGDDTLQLRSRHIAEPKPRTSRIELALWAAASLLAVLLAAATVYH